MPAYLNWLQYLATFSDEEIAEFNALGIEVSTDGDRLIWHCNDVALHSKAIEPVLESIPKILEHGFREFEMVYVDGGHKGVFLHHHLRGMARNL